MRTGILASTEAPVMIEERPVLELCRGVMNITHPNSLCAYSFSDDRMLYERFDFTLEDWMLQLRNQGINPCYLPVLQTNVPPATKFVTPTYKEIIKSMVIFIQHIHNQNYCIKGGIDIDKVVVVAENLKFYHYELIPYTEDLARTDYQSLGKLLNQHVFNGELNLPYDMEMFIDLLCNDPDVQQYPFLIRNHVALMKWRKLRNFLVELHDKQPYYSLLEKSFFNNAFQGVKILGRRRRTWDRNIRTSNFTALNLILTYRHAKAYVTKKNLELLRYMRNAVEHMGDHSIDGSQYNEKQAVMQLMSVNPLLKMVVGLQGTLVDYGILEGHFRLDEEL